MRNTLYRYNAEKCQYERVRVKTFDVIFYFCAVGVVSLLMLAGMLILHDAAFDSEKELLLRKENKAIEKNQVILAGQLNTIESALSFLNQEDEKLHAKFFGKTIDKEVNEKKGVSRTLLLADAAEFRTAAKNIEQHSTALYKEATDRNSSFSTGFLVTKAMAGRMNSFPTLQPVSPWNSDKVLSGFGKRVNPFHKGLYQHPGIDIALPRGTAIRTTAAGTVTDVKKNNLEAGYGNFVEVDHGHGFVTRYAHLEEILVKSGQKILKGSIIATSGNSGGSIAPHLHYEIIRDGKNVDPAIYMVQGLTSDAHHYLKWISEKQNQSLD